MDMSKANMAIIELLHKGASAAEVACRLGLPIQDVLLHSKQYASYIHSLPTEPIPEGYMHVNEAAWILHRTMREIQDYIHLEGLPSKKINGLRYVRMNDVREHLENRPRRRKAKRLEKKCRDFLGNQS